MLTNAGTKVPVSTIFSGKLRRYHGVGILQQLVDIPTLLSNIADVFLVLLGFLQSVGKLIVWRPDVVFTKGGFVCLPVGMAARLLSIPLVIHDSDAHPGLTNRILSRWATQIATGAPLEHYSYPKSKSHYVGIPVATDFRSFSEAEKRETRGTLGLADVKRPLVVVTGGGLGAKRINDAMVTIGDTLLEEAAVLHISGSLQYESLKDQVPQNPNYQLRGFVDKNMAQILGAADVVITRAGATTMLELAALAKPTIIIPNAQLTGGHQLKNAQVYAAAAKIIPEEAIQKDPRVLQQAITELLHNDVERQRLAHALHQFSRPEAAAEMADIIIAATKRKG